MIDEKAPDESIPASDPQRPSGDESSWRRRVSLTPADIQRRRERHRRRHIIIRLAVVVGGGILSIAGLILLWSPETGIPLLLVGLGLLALEFNWAARLMGNVATRAASVRMRFQGLSRLNKTPAAVAALGIVAITVWVLFLR